MGKFLGNIVGFVVAVAVGFAALVFEGFVLSVLWGWFMVPTFAAPHLAIVPAIGISTTVQFLSGRMYDAVNGNKKEEGMTPNQKLWRSIKVVFLVPAFALSFGWVVHMFM